MSDDRDETAGGEEGGGSAAERIIARFGGIRPMAAKLGVAVSTVQGWKIRGHIPPARRSQIEQAAEDQGLELEESDLEAAFSSGGDAGDEAEADAVARESDAEAGHGGTSLETEQSDATPWRSVGEEADKASEPGGATGTADAPPARTSPLPAMLLGGVLVAAGAVIVILLSDLWMPRDEPPAAAAVEALERRMERLEDQRVEGEGASELQRAIEQARSRLEEMDGRLANIEGSAGEGSGELESLRTVTERLSERLEGVETTLGANDEESRVGALEARVQELAGRIEEVAETPTEADEITQSRLDALDGRIEGAAGRIEALEARLRDALDEVAAARARVGEETVIALAAGQLREAFRTGRPYSEELDGLRRLAGQDEDIKAVLGRLEQQAEAGVPTLAALQASYAEAARRAVTAERAEGADSEWQGMLWERVSDLVSVRSVGEPEGNDAEAILARAESRLEGGDVAAALGELDALEGAPAEAMSAWRARAERRLEAEAALGELGRVSLNRLSGGEG
ncbi:carph-isopro domain-containing protein [Aquibaculum arenosum]|uniref:Mitofilin family membrane protein n=1 Tax=Aquibaculum arenosum TaxID=3032591 RepID=A0ABT5YKA7_9PROT|nr:mitofilin family membrane protein [Fodinicurvata sp. CAU 1616]MDF2094674.1 mitofilin family membrane protein [Fodinicurvata sp. CAU 1616]